MATVEIPDEGYVSTQVLDRLLSALCEGIIVKDDDILRAEAILFRLGGDSSFADFLDKFVDPSVVVVYTT